MSEQPGSFAQDAADPLPFESLSPSDFERLCRRLVEREGFQQVEAQTTVDGLHFDLTAWLDGEYWVFECKRTRQLDAGDAVEIVDRMARLSGKGDRATGIAFIVSGTVSDEARSLVQKHCKEARLDCQFWYGTELDFRVRQHSDIVTEFFAEAPEQDANEKEAVRISASDRVGGDETVMREVEIDPSAVVANATSDQPIRTKEQDRLGFGVYAEALASFISSEETTTPLVIGVDAPWGYGKTSLMHMIESELSPRRSWYLRFWLWLKLQGWRIRWLVASIPWGIAKLVIWFMRRTKRGASLSVALASWLEPIDRQTPAPDETVETPSAEPRTSLAERVLRWCVQARLPVEARHPTIWFNAWKFDDEQVLWSALAAAILDQIKTNYSWAGRLLFWVRLWVKRFRSLQAWTDVGRKILWPALLGVLGWLWLRWSGQIEFLPPVGQDAVQWTLWGGALLTAGLQMASIVKDPFSLSFSSYVKAPDYQEKIGFLGEFEEDFRRIVEIATSKVWGWRQRRLIIFIDDLDRCEPPRPADVVEAINVFLDSPGCVFVIGMDSRAVVASIETKYAALFERAQLESPDQPTLGRCFLEKIVQVNFALPPVPDHLMASLVTQVIGPRPYRETRDAASGDRTPRTRDAGPPQAPPREPKRSPAGAVRKTDVGSYRENAEVWDAISRGVRFLETNPRQVKRFINLFRLHLYIAYARGLFRELVDEETPGSGYTLDSLAAWVALAMRWPRIVSCLRQDPQRPELQRRLLWIAQLVDNDGEWIGRESIVGKKNENRLEEELMPLIPDDGIESDQVSAWLAKRLPGEQGDSTGDKSGDEPGMSWVSLPWDRWLLSQDFLRVIKALEAWWVQTGSANQDWLTIALLCDVPTSTGIPSPVS